jgi:hypothetical protein
MGTASSPLLGRRARRFRPGVEMLETRLVPAVTIQKVDLDGDSDPANDGAAGVDDFLIIGDSRNTVVQIEDNGTSLSVDIDFNGDGSFEISNQTSTASSGTITVELRLGGGNDRVEYRLIGDLDSDRRTLLADLGSGHDAFTFVAGNRDLQNSLLFFDVLGGGGKDTLDLPLAFDRLQDSTFFFAADLGGGNDRFNPTLAGQDVDTFWLDLHADLGAGNNQAVVQVGTIDAGIVTGFVADIGIVGGNSPLTVDNVTVNLNGAIHGGGNGRLTISTLLQGGNDRYTCNLQRGGFQVLDSSTVTLNVDAGTGNDTIAVNAVGSGQVVWGSLPVLGNVLALNFLGGAGKDRISVDLFATNLLDMRGRFNLAIEGGAGGDQITIQLQSASGADGNYQITAFAGAGNDLVTVDFDLNGAGATFSPIGFVVLNGGAGKDTLDDTAAGPPSTSEELFEVQI